MLPSLLALFLLALYAISVAVRVRWAHGQPVPFACDLLVWCSDETRDHVNLVDYTWGSFWWRRLYGPVFVSCPAPSEA